MAAKATLWIDPPTGLVASQALLIAVQLSVRLSESAGRKLGDRWR